MPYIPQKDRKFAEKQGPRTVGELNYLITLIIKRYYSSFGLSYTAAHQVYRSLRQHTHTADGAKNPMDLELDELYRKASPEFQNDFETAKYLAGLEFYRRVLAPYEDEKIKQNGDVY